MRLIWETQETEKPLFSRLCGITINHRRPLEIILSKEEAAELDCYQYKDHYERILKGACQRALHDQWKARLQEGSGEVHFSSRGRQET